MILVIDGDSVEAHVVNSTSFVVEGVWERNHIQNWITKHPEVLGEPLLILTLEFDKFDRSSERLDALAIDREGNLVVVEFKRSNDGGSAELRALRYAAMISPITIEDLIPYYQTYLARYFQEDIDVITATDRVKNFVEDPVFDGLSRKPRIILCSQDFGSELTTSVLWLRDFGIDISCVKITPYRTESALIIVPNKIIPLPEAEDYLVRIRRKEEIRQIEEKERKEQTFPYLLRERVLESGQTLYLRANLPKYVAFDIDNPLFQATVTGELGSRSLAWNKDGSLHSVSALAKKIFGELHPDKNHPGGVNGNAHWTIEGGTNLWNLDRKRRLSKEV